MTIFSVQLYQDLSLSHCVNIFTFFIKQLQFSFSLSLLTHSPHTLISLKHRHTFSLSLLSPLCISCFATTVVDSAAGVTVHNSQGDHQQQQFSFQEASLNFFLRYDTCQDFFSSNIFFSPSPEIESNRVLPKQHLETPPTLESERNFNHKS